MTKIPAWLNRGYNRTGTKLILIAGGSAYEEMLEMLDIKQRENYEQICEAASRGSLDEQEAFKLALCEILGYVLVADDDPAARGLVKEMVARKFGELPNTGVK